MSTVRNPTYVQHLLTGLCFLTGLGIAMGLLVTLNSLQIQFYVYYPHVAKTVLVSDSVDLYLFLLSTLSVPGTLLLYSRKLSKFSMIGILLIWVTSLFLIFIQQPYGSLILYVTVIYAAVLELSNSGRRRFTAQRLLMPALVVFVLIEFSALYYWASSSINPQGQFGLSAEQLELDFTFALFPVGMLMMLMLLFSWAWIPLVKQFRVRVDHVVSYARPETYKWDWRLMATSLDLFGILAILLFFYPYMAGQTWIVGVDSLWRYLNPLNHLASLGPSEAIAGSYHGLYLALLYLIQSATGFSASSIVKFAPLVLAFLLASVVFFTFLRAGWGQGPAVLASICVLFWFPTTLGMYAGIQANWLAYILWMLFLSYYFLNRRWNALVFVMQALMSVLILLLHPWTWGVFFVSLVLTAMLSTRNTWRNRSLQGVLASLVLALPVGLSAFMFFPGVRSDFGNAIDLYSLSLVHPNSLMTLGGAFVELFANWSSFLPPILLLLCIIGAYVLSEQTDSVARTYMIAWIATWCVGTILVAPSGYNPVNAGISETGIWRMLYVSPLPFLLALGVRYCYDLSRRIEGVGASTRHLEVVFILSAFAIFSVILVVSSNLIVRLAVVLAAVTAVTFLGVRFKYSLPRILLVSVLLMILANAAFRSLYPLLIDPRNLLGQ